MRLNGRGPSANEATADLRDPSVAALQRQFRCDLAQARRVHDMALTPHRAIAPATDADERRELVWACALHEMGRSISHHDYHCHSAYLMVMAHADAAGFSQSQQRRVAELFVAQRGGLKKVEAALARRPFARQTLCLRLAAIHCHALRDGHNPRLRLYPMGARRHVLHWEPGSVSHDSRTLHLLREEIALWQQHGHFALDIAQG